MAIPDEESDVTDNYAVDPLYVKARRALVILKKDDGRTKADPGERLTYTIEYQNLEFTVEVESLVPPCTPLQIINKVFISTTDPECDLDLGGLV